MVPMVAIPLVLAFLLAVQDKPQQSGTMSGTAVNSITHAPLNKVQLRATLAGADMDAPVPSTTTDAEGSFKLVDLPPGEYRLRAVRNGYLDTYYGARRAKAEGTLIALGAGEEVDGLRIEMPPSGVIAGTVRDDDGEPISGAAIFLWEQVWEYGRRTVSTRPILEAKTDDLGQYRIAGLAPGKYYVQATCRTAMSSLNEPRAIADHSAKSDQRPTVILPTLYPGVTDAATARTVEVGPGARVSGIDIPLVRAHVFRVTIQASGVAVNDMYLSSNPEMESLALHFRAARNNAGDFEFPAVPAGLYTVSASGSLKPDESSHPAVETIYFSGRQTALSVSRDMFTHVTVQPPALVTVHVIVEGKPEMKLRPGISLTSASNRFFPMQGSDNVLSPDPDRYNLYLESPPSNVIIKSMRAEGTDVFQNGLTISEGGGSYDVEIVLAPEGGTVDGTVVDKDDKPAAGATVVLIAEPKLRARYDSFHEFTADRQGRFHFDNVRPGAYKLFAWSDVEQDAWFDPEFLQKFEALGESVTVPARGHVSSQLRVP
jgi:protocatechuate 3,4-dioxygenase beta subunit